MITAEATVRVRAAVFTITVSLATNAALFAPSLARADAVVSNGRFTNVYVYPDPDRESWDSYLSSLPASQKPKDWSRYTSEAIDAATESLMDPSWPSYFGALHQYGGINPPRYFGSYAASKACVDAALRDRNNGVIEATTIRSLANCHVSGHDPSPQVNLIFSPDLHIGAAPGFPLAPANGHDICTMPGRHPVAYHWWGLNVPNFNVLPTAPGCAPSFNQFTESLSHEIVEMLSDPGQFGHGSWSGTELGDRCQSIDMTWHGLNVQRYRSDNDNDCWPLNFPPNSATATWILAEGSPVIRFTGQTHTLTLRVPAQRVVTNAPATDLQIWIQTGGDDLRGGNDNADVTLQFAGGSTLTRNINAGREWGNGQTHIARLALPVPPPKVSDLESVTITTHFGGGIGGDNWNVDKVALMVGFPAGSVTTVPPAAVTHVWLDASGGPLVRFTGHTHDFSVPVPSQDVGRPVRGLRLLIATGNDDLRGGGHDGDNCTVTINRAHGGPPIVLPNVNRGASWQNWTEHAVAIPLPAGGLLGGDIASVILHTGFGGGIGGDNWNVNRVRLEATLE